MKVLINTGLKFLVKSSVITGIGIVLSFLVVLRAPLTLGTVGASEFFSSQSYLNMSIIPAMGILRNMTMASASEELSFPYWIIILFIPVFILFYQADYTLVWILLTICLFTLEFVGISMLRDGRHFEFLFLRYIGFNGLLFLFVENKILLFSVLFVLLMLRAVWTTRLTRINWKIDLDIRKVNLEFFSQSTFNIFGQIGLWLPLSLLNASGAYSDAVEFRRFLQVRSFLLFGQNALRTKAQKDIGDYLIGNSNINLRSNINKMVVQVALVGFSFMVVIFLGSLMGIPEITALISLNWDVIIGGSILVVIEIFWSYRGTYLSISKSMSSIVNRVLIVFLFYILLCYIGFYASIARFLIYAHFGFRLLLMLIVNREYKRRYSLH